MDFERAKRRRKSIEPITQYIIKLADKKVPIYRCTISLDEYDAIRLGYDTQGKWKALFESKLVSFAKKMNVKYEDLQYTGAVHLEAGHPHFQIMLWSKQRDKMNYYINYGRINKMRDEFTNAIFREDLIELYKEKDRAKKGIIEKNVLLQKLKKANTDSKFIKEMVQYEKDFANTDEEEIKLIEELKPDVVVTDLMRNHEFTGLDIIKDYSEKEKSPKFVVVSFLPDYGLCCIYKNITNCVHKFPEINGSELAYKILCAKRIIWKEEQDRLMQRKEKQSSFWEKLKKVLFE